MRPKTLTTAITVAAMTLKISARLKIDTKNTDHTKRCDQHDSSTFVQKNKDARVHYAVPKQQPPPPSPTLTTRIGYLKPRQIMKQQLLSQDPTVCQAPYTKAPALFPTREPTTQSVEDGRTGETSAKYMMTIR